MTPPFFPGLTLAQVERLKLIVQGCADIARAVEGVLQGGFEGRTASGDQSRGEKLARELGASRVAIDLLLHHGEIDRDTMENGRVDRWLSIPTVSEHQERFRTRTP